MNAPVSLPTTRLVPIAAADVDRRWPAVFAYIDAACRRGPCGDLSADDLKAACERGDHQLWIIANDRGEAVCAVVTGVLIEKSGRRVCVLLATGGVDHGDWLHLIDLIEAWAARQDCDAVRLIGRAGWGRILPDYRLRGVLLEKAFGNG